MRAACVTIGLALAAALAGCLKLDLQDGFPCSSSGECPSPYHCESGGCYRHPPSSGQGGSGGSGGANVDAGPGGSDGMVVLSDAATDTTGGGGSGGSGGGGSGGSGGGGSGGGGSGGGGSGGGGSGGGGSGGGGSGGHGGSGGGGSGGSGGGGSGGSGAGGGGAGGGNVDAGQDVGHPDAAPDAADGSGGSGGCTSTSCAAGTVCERHAPMACLDPDWAEWPMPNGRNDVNAESYTDNGDGTVTDRVTGLMWQQAPTEDGFTWPAALTHCPQLTLGGHNDWRLPTVIELVSLVDFTVGIGSTTVNATFFPNMAGGLYWSSTPVSTVTNFAWEVNFNNGVLNADATIGGNNPVICVR